MKEESQKLLYISFTVITLATEDPKTKLGTRIANRNSITKSAAFTSYLPGGPADQGILSSLGGHVILVGPHRADLATMSVDRRTAHIRLALGKYVKAEENFL